MKPRKPRKIIPFGRPKLTANDRELLSSLKRENISISAAEMEILWEVHWSLGLDKVYLMLVALSDHDGVVRGQSLRSLSGKLLGDDQMPLSAANTRARLLGLQEIGLIDFDSTSGTASSPLLVIRLPYQAANDPA